jgi:hypothetical protein
LLVRIGNHLLVEFPDGVTAPTLADASITAGTVADLVNRAWQQPRPELAPVPYQKWDTPGFTPPAGIVPDEDLLTDGGFALLSTDTETSRYLIGSVAVGFVIVSRDQGVEQFTQAETITTIAEVLEGLAFLAQEEPRAQVSFDVDIRLVTVNAQPGPDPSVTNPYEQFERGWRDAALADLGYTAGRAGSRAYAKHLQQNRNTAWSFVAYFTKYPLNHFAYAGQERLVMDYANDGWGPNRINQVFAHELCHVFGAADEYGGCKCGSRHGHLLAPNNNCTNCVETQVPCLMDGNVLSLCTWSRQQIGWDNEVLNMRTFMQSVVVGPGANPPHNKGHHDYTFTPPNSTRVLGGWWSLQEDASGSDAFKEFVIGGNSGSDNNTPTINANSITFRVAKKDNTSGKIRILFCVLYV